MFLHSIDIYYIDYLYHLHIRFSMQNSARQTVSRMYMPFLNDLKILPANPTQNYSVHNFIMLTSANAKGVLWFFQAYFLFFSFWR